MFRYDVNKFNSSLAASIKIVGCLRSTLWDHVLEGFFLDIEYKHIIIDIRNELQNETSTKLTFYIGVFNMNSKPNELAFC